MKQFVLIGKSLGELQQCYGLFSEIKEAHQWVKTNFSDKKFRYQIYLVHDLDKRE